MAPRAGSASAAAAAAGKRRRKDEATPAAKQAKVGDDAATVQPKTDLDLVRDELLTDVNDLAADSDATGAAISASSRALLAEALVHAVDSAGGERHSYQEEFLGVARKALSEGEIATKLALETADKQLSMAKEQMTVAESGASAAEVAVAAARASIDEREAAVKAVVAKVREADAAHRQGEAEVNPVVEAQKAAEEEQVEVIAIQDQAFRPLADEDLAASDVAALSEKVLAFLAALPSAEKALLAAAPGALAAPRGTRGGFDALTLKAVAAAIDAEASAVAAKVDKAGPAVQSARATALGLWAILDLAREDEADARKALAGARVDAEVAESEARARERERQRRGGLATEAQALRTAKERRLEACQASLAALERLVAPPTTEAAETVAEVAEAAEPVDVETKDGAPSAEAEAAAEAAATVAALPTPTRSAAP